MIGYNWITLYQYFPVSCTQFTMEDWYSTEILGVFINWKSCMENIF